MSTSQGDDPTAVRPVRIDLSSHSTALMRIVLSPEMFERDDRGKHTDQGLWLLQRYQEIVPAVLPDALRSIGSGDALSSASLQCIRQSASSVRRTQVPVSVAVRGGVPALQAFGAFLQSICTTLSAAETMVVASRAGLVAHELGACWLEAWNAPDTDPHAERSPLSVETVPSAGEDTDPALEMVALVAAGRSTEQIAMATAYSPQAVKWHLGRLMRSWNAANRPALVSVAFMRGLLMTRRDPVDDDR